VTLDAAVEDVEALERILRDRYGFTVRLLRNAEATRKAIIDSLEELRNSLQGNDNLLIYYAGHGVMDDHTRQGYWQPVDAESESRANWISSTEITNPVRGAKAKHVLVISDSCFAKALMDRTRSGAGGPTAKGLSAEEREKACVRYSGMHVRRIMVSGGYEPVQDSGGDGHSIFASALIDKLRDNDSVVNVGSFFDELKARVMSKMETQVPEYWPIVGAKDEGGDFVFVPK
jgi:uncharacterized caspase-like protein